MAQPALTEKQRQQITDALEECVVLVQAGGSTGTGFFIDARQVLTCRHVIEPATRAPVPITVTYRSSPGAPVAERLAATLLGDPPPGWPDVAILSVPAADSRCVVMDPGPVADGTPLLTAGYPAKALVDYQAQRFTAGLRGLDEDGHPLWRIEGDVVTPGMSGSPVVSLQSGFVCGIVGLTKGSNAALGGFATLFSDFIKGWPDLAALSYRPPAAAQPWVRILTPLQLKNAGRRRDTGARGGEAPPLPRLDLEVEKGEADTWGDWQVSAQTNQAGQVVQHVRCTVSDLGDGVMRAVDSWSRRQTLKLQDEVEILGDVLRRAMLPSGAASVLADALKTDGLLFRVCLDMAPRLSHLPWEFACGDDRLPFAVSRTMTFSRFVDVADRAPDAKDKIKVLAVIECPESISKGLPGYQDENGKSIRPSASTFEGTIRGSAVSKGERIEVKYATNKTRTELEDIFAADEWDIVHYIGFAFQGETEQEFVIALGGEQGLRPARVDELAELIDTARCSVFIAEFHKFGPGHDMTFPADLSGLISLLRSTTHAHPQALIITQSPMNVVELGRFNETFYERISSGRTVEEAVQFGRRDVRNQIYRGRDVAAFGSFMVITTRAGEVRVLRATDQGRPRPEIRAPARGEGAETAPGPDADLGPAIGQFPETGEVNKTGEVSKSGELFTSGEHTRRAEEISALRARLAALEAPTPGTPDAATRLQAPARDRDEKVT
jgi:Trypsin-like peptidase domain/CHAT domain